VATVVIKMNRTKDRPSSKRRRLVGPTQAEHLTAATLTPAAVAALDHILSSFLSTLANQLAKGDNKRVTCEQVHSSLCRMGMSDLATRSAATALVPTEQKKKKPPNKKKKKREFTQEQLQEQERLLSASKNKLLSNAK
jgi:hypothetical protein